MLAPRRLSRRHRDAAGIHSQDNRILDLAHEKVLPFFREICSRCRVVQNDYSIGSGCSFAYAVFYRIHGQLEAVFYSKLAVD